MMKKKFVKEKTEKKKAGKEAAVRWLDTKSQAE
mgnify:CR=1 FL=1